MTLFATDDGLILTEEGAACRARAGNLNYLFRDSTEQRVRTDYLRSREFTQSRLAPRWRSVNDDQFNSDARADLIQEITLHWMYYYIVNGFPVNLTDDDLAHPQTRRIIRKHVERRFDSLTACAITVGAILFGVTDVDFQKGIEGDDRFAEMW